MVDIIVVGGGGGGMMAAYTASRAGIKTLLVEKKHLLGGTHYFSGGSYVAADTRLARQSGTDDTPDKFFNDAMRFGKEKNHPELLRKLVNHAGEVFDWFLDHGLELMSDKPGPALAHAETGTFRTYWARNGGKSYIRILKPLLEQERQRGNLEIATQTTLIDLIVDDDGGVSGVKVKKENGSVEEIRAKAIVLTTGGYGANREMIKTLNPGFDSLISACPPHADGSAIKIAQKVGADIVNTNFQQTGLIILPSPRGKWRTRAAILRLGPPHIDGPILVNSNGCRFVNEDIPDPSTRKDAIGALPDKTAYLIFDQAIKDSMGMCPVMRWDWKRFDRVAASDNNHQIILANTVEELARKCGLPENQVIDTINNWNLCVEKGIDPAFKREPKRKISQPPYYAVKGQASITITMGGLKVNGDSNVLDQANQHIPGLFAVGEVAGMGQYMGDGLNSGFGQVAPFVLGKLVALALSKSIQS